MTTSPIRACGFLVVCVISACGPTLVVPGTDESTGDDGPVTPSSTGTAPPPVTSSSSTGAAESTVDPDGSGPSDDGPDGSFIPYDDLGSDQCDLFVQDCPPGQKCMPYSNDGGAAWNATGCFPIVDDPAGLHEPCTVEGNGVSGMDTCDLGLMCWNVDPETLEGACVSMCSGDDSNPICEEPNTYCTISGDGAIVICLPTCDPLDPGDCGEGQICHPLYSDQFGCAPDASGDMGAAGDPCEFLNACDPGHFCASAEIVPDCQGSIGCCTAYCDLTGVPDCLPGQVCSPWFEDPADASPGNDDVGYCGVPM